MIRIVFVVFSMFTILSDGFCTTGEESPSASVSLSYTADFAGCMRGGLKTGFTYLGLLNLSSDLELWKGGNFFINLQNTHNGMPSNNYVGDIQAFDNIENGNHSYLYQLYYRHDFNRFWFLAGLHDLNSEFLASNYGCEYLNSSFGIMPVVSLNSPVSIFPKTSLAFLAGYSFERFSVKAGIYEGDPGSFEKDPYNLNLSVSRRDGSFGIAEIQTDHNFLNSLKGSIKLGMSFHSCYSACPDTIGSSSGNYNFYLIADQQMYSKSDDTGGLGFMVQLGIAPSRRNLNNVFISAGLSYKGIFSSRKNDLLGAGMAYASMSHNYMNLCSGNQRSETVFELYYKLFLSEQIFLQPNFQYIINPGLHENINNACAFIFRIGITN